MPQPTSRDVARLHGSTRAMSYTKRVPVALSLTCVDCAVSAGSNNLTDGWQTLFREAHQGHRIEEVRA